MKKLLFGVLLAMSFSVSAQTWSASNEGGGEIVLTLRQDKCKRYGSHLVDGYSYVSNGQVVDFCWAVVDDMIRVVYLHNSSMRIYKPELFSRKTEK
jgi:hypothetical protein